ncbi:tetratricopeptide repeat protein [Prochlorococcus marinus]|uniref:protein O-GlcNAc transferase n=1 Tax=Prochlorococcus marinus (strain MIT 9303) TaxID=59922 RepID=A2C6C6_PROM3|nr:Hypothetical protein P9303_02811 [Prochlorococcus marinus str. MIT 9303]
MKGFGEKSEAGKQKKINNEKKGLLYFNKAVKSHAQGDIQQAKLLYLKSIANGLENESLYTNLGVIYKNEGDFKESGRCYRSALRINPFSCDAYTNLSSLAIAENEFTSALDLANKAIKLNPNCDVANLNAGKALLELGDLEQALASTLKSLELQPDNHTAHMNLGSIYQDLGELDQALASTIKYLELKPDNPDALMNLGGIYKDLGQLDQALASTLKNLEIKPDNPTAHMNLGVIYKDLGNLDQALTSTLKSLELQPDNHTAHMNLGSIYQDLGNLDQALTSTLKSLELKRDNPDALTNLGGIYKDLGNLDQALTSTLKSLELKPNNPDALTNLGGIYKEQGQLDQALTAYKKASTLAPKELRHVAASTLFFSDLHKDNDEINSERTAYRQGIKQLARSSTEMEQPKSSYSTDMFWIAYHNRDDDREILESLGRALASLQKGTLTKAISGAGRNLASRGKIRLGICSDYLRSHSIGKLYAGMIKEFKDRGFNITIFRGPQSKTDEESLRIDSYAVSSIKLPESPQAACEIIRNEHLNVLLYPDIGMSPYTYILAMFRLAQVQVTGWGHPSTTGLKTMDYFLSCEPIEPDNAQSKYTEQLIKLKKLPCIYTPPETTAISSSRDKFMLPSDKILIGIPQSLFKFHPDYDVVLEEILYRLPNAKFVLIEGQNKSQTERLKNRWATKAPKTLENAIFLQTMPQADYLCLLKTVDILLDPIYFGSGNTFYESMAVGTPLVTMPGDYMRGRIVAGGYKQMKLENAPIAANTQEYIEITVMLAENVESRKCLKKQIEARAQKYLFNDQEAANEIIEFLQAAVDCRHKTGGLLPIGWIPSQRPSQ